MDKLPTSGPLFDAINELNALKILTIARPSFPEASGLSEVIPQGRTMESLSKQIAKKYNVDEELLTQAAKEDRYLKSNPNAGYPSSSQNIKASNSIAKQSASDLEKNILPRKLLSGNIGKPAQAEMSAIEGMGRAAIPAIAGAVEAIPPLVKYGNENPTANVAEAALSPEGSKGIARGVGSMLGMEGGAYLGSMSPVAKGPASIAGAVGGSMAGAKLAEMLTGIPAVDALIRKAYEKQLREREAKMVEEAKASAE
jgi:hypothetical protein